MRRRKRNQDGEVALRLDISKAYDRVSWNYLWHRMKTMGFDDKWVRWMKLCVTTVHYMACMNGTYVGPIYPSRGLRQGDLQSPYLFLLCVEGLSHSINKVVIDGAIHGCQISASAPAITHLLFTNDSFLFFKANVEETQMVKNLLNTYEHQSSQVINFQKAGIFFSSNVRRDNQTEISGTLGVQNDLRESKYLGLPSLVGRSKKAALNFVKKRV